MKNGYVEWLKKYSARESYGLHLVHYITASQTKCNGGCQYDARSDYDQIGADIRNMPLSYYLGSAGLMEFFELMDEKSISEADLLEMIKRSTSKIMSRLEAPLKRP